MKGKKIKKILLPLELYKRAEERAQVTGFGSVHEYAEFVLNEVLKDGEVETTLNQEEEVELKRRLKELGYLS